MSWMELTTRELEKRGHQVLILSHPRSMFNDNCADDLRIIPFRIGFDNNPLALIKLIGYIKKHDIDLLVTNIKKEVTIGSLAARYCQIPLIRRIGTDLDYDNEAVQNLYKKNHINATISPCKSMIEAISEKHNFIDRRNMYFVYNGREILQFSKQEIKLIKHKYKLPENKILIGSISQLSKTKNISGIIRAFSTLKHNHDNIHLVIAGDGPEKENLQSLQLSLELKDEISFLGFVKETQQLAAVFDIGVLFSYKEGFANSIVEMMSVGNAVICTDVGGQKEIISDGQNGFLIEAGDENLLTGKMEFLLNNPKVRKAVGQKALETVKANFNEIRMVEEFEKILKEVISNFPR